MGQLLCERVEELDLVEQAAGVEQNQRRADLRTTSHRKTIRPADRELAANAVRQLHVHDLADAASPVGPPPNLSFPTEVRVDRERDDDR
jgi:hypothetical protein